MLREGGGLINLVRADNPLFFAAPSSISFPMNGGTMPVDLTDAGGGTAAGRSPPRSSAISRALRSSTDPRLGSRRPDGDRERLPLGADGDVTGFVILTQTARPGGSRSGSR